MRAILEEGLRALSLDASRAEVLEDFARRMLRQNEVMNLTRITEDGDVARLHLLDSAFLLTLTDFRKKNVLDLGTGAGFPGMPLRILEHDFDLTLLDALGKRIDWLRRTCDDMGLCRVTCLHARAEEAAAEHRERFDIVCSRAVAELRLLAELALPLTRVGGLFLAMKSVESDAELADAEKAIRTLGGRVREVRDYTVPCSDVRHRVILIEKVSATPAAYPRAFAKIKKQPL